MSELNAMSCDELADVAAELALGVLTGRERAQAIEHLDRCDTCREHVRQLTLTGEELLGLLPGIEPPAGFETRVMDRLGFSGQRWPRIAGEHRLRPAGEHRLAPAGKRPSRTRRMLAVAAVALAVVAVGLGGWGLRGATSSPSAGGGTAKSGLYTASLITASNHLAGSVYLYNGQPGWLYMSVRVGSGNGAVVCQLVSRDGHVTTVGSFQLTGGYGFWGSPDHADPDSVASARLITANGKVLATATFRATT
jgi:hypothetical protein